MHNKINHMRMSLWNMGGMNPKVSDFLDKHPKATMIGFCWSLYWRLTVIIFLIEALIFIVLFLLGVSLFPHVPNPSPALQQ